MIETREQPRPATAAATTNGSNGHYGRHGGGAPPAGTRHRFALRRWALPAVLVALVPVILFGVLYLHDQASYVSTDNAVITGTLVQVGPTSAGQVRAVTPQVGDDVHRGEAVATVQLASGQTVRVRAPFDGVVVARYASPGDAITSQAGKAILAVLNPSELWVEARIDEVDAGRVQAGQRAEITLDASRQTVIGHVTSV
ncbi:MAG: hypothetical protein QOF51_3826, partial [Chloroflexota bacterium]|nr:hypothetical protein [Chloroflexota bacterium]